MVRRLFLRSGLAMLYVSAVAMWVPAEASETRAGICFNGCSPFPCSAESIAEQCALLCDESTGGLCSDEGCAPSLTRLICSGNVS
jgi:hypothetical protein